MTRDKLIHATWAQFAECMDFPVVEDATAAGMFRVHIEQRPMEKK
jgi:hypothetical protein